MTSLISCPVSDKDEIRESILADGGTILDESEEWGLHNFIVKGRLDDVEKGAE